MAETENKTKILVDFRDILAIVFILVSVCINITAIALVMDSGLSETASILVGGSVQAFNTLLALVVQYYFRKRPAESSGDK